MSLPLNLLTTFMAAGVCKWVVVVGDEDPLVFANEDPGRRDGLTLLEWLAVTFSPFLRAGILHIYTSDVQQDSGSDGLTSFEEAKARNAAIQAGINAAGVNPTAITMVDASHVIGPKFMETIASVDWNTHCAAQFKSLMPGTSNLITASAKVFQRLGGYTSSNRPWSRATNDLIERIQLSQEQGSLFASGCVHG